MKEMRIKGSETENSVKILSIICMVVLFPVVVYCWLLNKLGLKKEW